ncbi:MAG: hypothetical protein M0P73_06775 [Syntrophobacterales bacterium]|jgi:hypothetical protein|nr:hypothetical protein [Syntrophobacterales bacterium]
MKQKVLIIMLALGLGLAWSTAGLAGDVGYRFKEQSAGLKPTPGPPTSVAVATDALIGRPLGLATTIAGTAVFVASLPFNHTSESVNNSAWGLVGRPAGWTFVRPMGEGAPKYEEKGVFKP